MSRVGLRARVGLGVGVAGGITQRDRVRAGSAAGHTSVLGRGTPPGILVQEAGRGGRGRAMTVLEGQRAARRDGHRLVDAGRTPNGLFRMLVCERCGGRILARTPGDSGANCRSFCRCFCRFFLVIAPAAAQTRDQDGTQAGWPPGTGVVSRRADCIAIGLELFAPRHGSRKVRRYVPCATDERVPWWPPPRCWPP